ncbi:ubiquitin carboxyl-terminal hydrolase 23-like isoform X1 [Hibiscus syriacus]|uniref:ubiquitin carboxyl-terminal hydrolase 23-like isoform X1 n=1 Tax=Hibiscus syriacus TaxID=106335 RepID=UPI0019223151|nr:ubiquitin carboxyl-terminal hydrolase 23-like isoform X1 [Hibiscus syriacus]
MEASMISSSELTVEAEMEERSDLRNCSVASSSNFDLSKKKIEFHPARKPFKGLDGGDFIIQTLNPGLDSKRVNGVGSDLSGVTGRKVDGTDMWENGLDPVLSLKNTFRKIGAGLENLGNTCFLNSVLQCLTYTEPLVAYLQSGNHQNSCRIAGFCALCAIQKHVRRALQSTGRILAPNDLVSNLRCISRNFRNSQQEDAHEYMVNLLESMHKCCLPSGVSSESPSAYEKSLVHKIFGGRLRSQVKCLQCSYGSSTFDPFLDLSLEIVKADSLHKALKNFTAAELLDGGERQYQCQRCKQNVQATKQLTVYNAPHVLTIHLKRFWAYDFGQKNDRKVEFGRTLDMKPFVSGSNEGDLKYTLYGVLVHCGWSTHSGHYYCFVRTSTGLWYSLDDNRVVQVSEQTVMEQKAYMLFYVRDRDRRNTAPIKAIDILQKDNLKANVNGRSVFNQNLKEHVQTGPVGHKLSASGSYAAMIQNVTANGSLSRETIMKVVPTQPNNAQPMSEDSVLKESMLPPSNVPLQGSSQACASNLVHGENLQSSAYSVVGNVTNTENSTVTTGVKDSDCHERGNSKTGLGIPLTILPDCGGLQNTGTATIVSKQTLLKIGVSSTAALEDLENKAVKKVPGEALSMSTANEKLKDVQATRSPDKPNCDSSQVGDVPCHSTIDKTLNKRGDDSSRKNLSKPPCSIPNGSLETQAPGYDPNKKPKKKHLKCQLKNMHIGVRLKFFRASLHIQSKKKLKRSMKRTINAHVRKEILLDKDCLPLDLGPSTSENSSAISLGKNHRRRKKPASGTALKSVNNSGSLTNNINGEVKKRIYQNGTVASDKQAERSSGSVLEANWHNSREVDSLKEGRIDSSSNRHDLTQGLGDAAVARWDDMGIASPLLTEEANIMESKGIGYTPDEWDEEYDRGKRKKIRQNKHKFGGPNLFQQIASKKTHFKKAELNHSSSEY